MLPIWAKKGKETKKARKLTKLLQIIILQAPICIGPKISHPFVTLGPRISDRFQSIVKVNQSLLEHVTWSVYQFMHLEQEQ